jgi:peptidoglycan/LPS O-acetylase OafA/YrhL
MTFSGEFWSRHVFVGSNEPYWSLGFEVPYYVLFGIATYLRGYWKGVLVVVWTFIVGPKIILYLPLWLLGAFVYDFLSRRKSHQANDVRVGLSLMLAGLLLYVVNKSLGPHSPVMFELGPVAAMAQSAAYFYIVGISVALSIMGFDILAGERPLWNGRIEGIIRWLAGGSFTLYVTHEPLLALARSISPGVAQRPYLGLVGTGVVFLLTLLLAEFGERRKSLYAQFVGWIFLGRLQSVHIRAKP